MATYNGTSGDDYYSGTGGADTINGNDGNDYLQGADGYDTIHGGEGNDTILGASNNFEVAVDYLYGDNGDDWITAHLLDVVDGGAGYDVLTLYGWAAPNGLTIDFTPIWTGGTITVAGAAISNMDALDRFYGGSDNDYITTGSVAGSTVTVQGGSGNDVLIGGAGRDWLHGGGGIDSISGLGGDDRLYGDIGDTIDGGSGTDSATVSYSGAAAGITADFTAVLGGATATLGGVTLTSIEHFEAVTGSSYDDVLDLSADPYDGIVWGNATLFGGAGNDTLTGGAASNRIDGGTGNDTMTGGGGDDEYFVDSIYDLVVEGTGGGGDAVNSSIDYTLAANVENLYLLGTTTIGGRGNALANTLYGNSAANSLKGMDGNDLLYGNDGADALIGGTGRDQLYGGAGADEFRFNPGDFSGLTTTTADTISDFSHAQGDRIVLSTIDAVAGGGDDAFTFIGGAAFSGTAGELRYQYVTGQTMVYGDTDGDGTADFAVAVTGNFTLVSGDFVL